MRGGLARTLVRFGVYVMVAISIAPVLWALSTSFKTSNEFYANPPSLFPPHPTSSHYSVLFGSYGVGRYLAHTAIIASANTLLILALAVPSAYTVARYRLGQRAFLSWILLQRILPPILSLIPLFLVYRQLGLLDTYSGMIVAYGAFNLPLAVWMLVGFFRDFPQDIQDQAMVDGCTELWAVLRIVLPLLAPALVALSLFLFVFAWNEFLYAAILSGSRTSPLMILFYNLLQSPAGTLFGEAASSVLIGAVPAYIMALFFQRYIIRGLAAGGIK
jgi:multiple sugar transport system permease protein